MSAVAAVTIEIKHRITGAVLYSHQTTSERQASGLAMRDALEAAAKGKANLRSAYLSGADLSGAYLSGAYLSGAYLRSADLSGADLRSADLSGADLSGADLRSADLSGAPAKRATPEQSIENLDKVRAIILDDADKLEMSDWHQGSGWRDRTCAEEVVCGTAHCLAGWLQVCSTDPDLRAMHAQDAGALAAPVAAKMFFRGATEVLSWLEQRKYVAEVEQREKAIAERAAAIAAKTETPA